MVHFQVILRSVQAVLGNVIHNFLGAERSGFGCKSAITSPMHHMCTILNWFGLNFGSKLPFELSSDRLARVSRILVPGERDRPCTFTITGRRETIQLKDSCWQWTE